MCVHASFQIHADVREAGPLSTSFTHVEISMCLCVMNYTFSRICMMLLCRRLNVHSTHFEGSTEAEVVISNLPLFLRMTGERKRMKKELQIACMGEHNESCSLTYFAESLHVDCLDVQFGSFQRQHTAAKVQQLQRYCDSRNKLLLSPVANFDHRRCCCCCWQCHATTKHQIWTNSKCECWCWY